MQQGGLDGLCGLYALINAARWTDPALHISACKTMFQGALEWLHATGLLPGVLYKGIPAKALLCLHGRVIRRYRPGLKLKRPFFGHEPTSDEEFWAALVSFLEAPHRALVVDMFSGQWSHWTVISRITEGQVHLFDSGDLVWIRRRSCTCSRDRPGGLHHRPGRGFSHRGRKGQSKVAGTVKRGREKKVYIKIASKAPILSARRPAGHTDGLLRGVSQVFAQEKKHSQIYL